MIELLLAADRLLAEGSPEQIEQAAHLYAQVAEADPRNAIAVVGLARVALAHGNEAEAVGLARRALAIDADNPAARRLVEEGAVARAHVAAAEPAPVAAEPQLTREPVSLPELEPAPPSEPAPAPAFESAPDAEPAPRSLVDRIRAFLHIGG